MLTGSACKVQFSKHPKEDSVERAVLSRDFGTSTETSLAIKQSPVNERMTQGVCVFFLKKKKRSEVFEGTPSLSLMSC